MKKPPPYRGMTVGSAADHVSKGGDERLAAWCVAFAAVVYSCDALTFSVIVPVNQWTLAADWSFVWLARLGAGARPVPYL